MPVTADAEDTWPSELFLHGLDLLDGDRSADALPILEAALVDAAQRLIQRLPG